jgi:hypothetical protein
MPINGHMSCDGRAFIQGKYYYCATAKRLGLRRSAIKKAARSARLF